MLLRRHGKSIFTNCTPTCPCPGSLKKHIERKGKEKDKERKGQCLQLSFSIFVFNSSNGKAWLPLTRAPQRSPIFRSVGRSEVSFDPLGLGLFPSSSISFLSRKDNFHSLANVKNQNLLGTERKQPSFVQTHPNRKEKRTVPLRSVPRSISKALCDVSLRLSRVLKFQSSSPPGFGCIHKMLSFPFPVPFLFVAFLSNMLLRRHGKSIFTNCTPTCPCPFPFPFLVMNLVFPGNLKSILERKGKEKDKERKGHCLQFSFSIFVFNSSIPIVVETTTPCLLQKHRARSFPCAGSIRAHMRRQCGTKSCPSVRTDGYFSSRLFSLNSIACLLATT